MGFAVLCVLSFLIFPRLTEALAWSNGGYSSDPSNPDYGTHDWIAQHALDWLPPEEKQYVVNNLAAYLYGTELPDNSQVPDGIGDTINHHFYYSSAGTVVDDAAADRASAVYTQALNFLISGDSANAAKYVGVMSHYIVDLAVFGHVMGSGTDWEAETHHSDYESYVNERTSTYSAEFNIYLSFDGSLRIISAYDAAKELAYDTTFDMNGDLTCLWMDQNYDWNNPSFRNRCGESLNLAVNYLTDVLHTLYIQNEPASAVHVVINEFDQDPPTDQNYVFDEWVELYNPTQSAVDIAGWSVSTTHGWTVTVSIPPATTLQPQAYYIVWHTTGQWLDDTDESIILRNYAGVEIDRTPIKSDPYNDNRAWARYPNGQDTDSDLDWRFQISTRGYSNGGEPANNPPTAFIDSISPNPATQGQSISFSGHGTDSDGSIVAYNWRSSIDGQLSSSASFSTSGLSVGTHTIYFKVQDDDGAWSTEVTRTLTMIIPLSAVKSSIIEAAAGSVYFVRTGNIYDDSALGFFYSKCINTQNIILQTDPAKINQTTGRPLFTGNLVTFGGRFANKVTKYYEDRGLSMITFSQNSTHYIFARGSIVAYAVAKSTYNFSREDFFVMQVLQEDSRLVFLIWGIEYTGTYASGICFADIVYPNLTSYNQGYYIFKWTDLDGNCVQTSNEITQIASGS